MLALSGSRMHGPQWTGLRQHSSTTSGRLPVSWPTASRPAEGAYVRMRTRDTPVRRCTEDRRFVGFHPLLDSPDVLHTHHGRNGDYQFLFLERAEGFGREIMKGYTSIRDTMCSSHTPASTRSTSTSPGSKGEGMKVVVFGSAESAGEDEPALMREDTLELGDVVVDTCVRSRTPPFRCRTTRQNRPVSTMAFVTAVWMTSSPWPRSWRPGSEAPHPSSHNNLSTRPPATDLTRPRRIQAARRGV